MFKYFPITNQKKPAISGWQEAATGDSDQLTRWSNQFPGCWFAMPTGDANGVFVVDFDDPQYIPAFNRAYGEAGYIVKTRRGYHYYYAMPTDGRQILNKNGWGKVKIDVRGTGGLIAVPCNGAPYQVVKNNGIGPAPESLLSELVYVATRGTQQTVNVPIDDNLLGALAYIEKLAEDYQTWLNVGLALHHSIEDKNAAFQLFWDWSNVADCAGVRPSWDELWNKWQTFASEQRQITVFSAVYQLAQAHGYQGGITNNKPFDAVAGFDIPDKSIVDYAVESIQQDAEIAVEGVSDIALGFGKRITNIMEYAGLYGVHINYHVIDAILNGVMYNGDKGKFMIISPEGAITYQTEQNTPGSLVLAFGSIMDETTFNAAAGGTDIGEKEVTRLRGSGFGVMADHLRQNHQRQSLGFEVDIFATKSILKIEIDKAALTLKHLPFDEGEFIDGEEEILADYKTHFPQIDEFLSWIAANRFTSDPKNSLMWLKAESDWGKNFTIGALADLGAVVNVSMETIEKCYEGGPVGLTPNHFTRALVVFVDETKKVKAEVKQLQQTLTFSPKNGAQTTVRIYTKIFASAEHIPSLADVDLGVEKQFAKRFTHWDLKGDLTARPLFMANSKKYHNVVKRYCAIQLNGLIDHYKAMGQDNSANAAFQYCAQFHKVYGIANTYGLISDNMEGVANDFINWVRTNRPLNIVYDSDKQPWLTHVPNTFAEFRRSLVSESQKIQYKHKENEIRACLSADGTHNTINKTINGKNERRLPLKLV